VSYASRAAGTGTAIKPSSNAPGILAMLAGSASFVGNDTLVKLLGASLPAGEIMLLRGVPSVGLLLAAMYWFGAHKIPLSILLSPAFALRLVGEMGATFTFILSLPHLRLADTTGIQQFQPLAITAASALFLAEPVGWRRWMAALAGLIGVLLIVKPGTGAFEPYALLSGCCVLFVALRDLATRAVKPGIHPVALAFASAAATMACGVFLLPFESWSLPTATQYAGLTLNALFLAGGYLLVTIAVRIAELPVISPFRYVSVIYAVISQWLIWSVLPDRIALFGIALVVGAGLYTFHREQVRYVVRA
jgi:drug/metabolite transporter (DMT)-like permease